MEQLKNILSVVVFIGGPIIAIYVTLTVLRLDKVVSKGSGKLKEMFGKTSIGRRMEIRAKNREAMKQQRAGLLESKLASGNYRGLNPFYRARSASNRAKADVLGRLSSGTGVTGAVGRAVAGRMGGGYLAEQIIQDRKLRSKERAEAIAEFNGDTVLARAWAETGGGRRANNYTGPPLSTSQRAAFRQLQLSGRQNSAESFIAAQDMLSQEGEGSMHSLEEAVTQARTLGASDVDLGALRQSSYSNWRKQGRGDIQEVAPQGSTGWASIRPETLTRHALDEDTKRQDFASWFVNNATDAQRRAYVAAYPRMEGRAQQQFVTALQLQFNQPDVISALQSMYNITVTG